MVSTWPRFEGYDDGGGWWDGWMDGWTTTDEKDGNHQQE